MKHPLQVSAVLLSMFLAAQVMGLFVVGSYVDVAASQKASEEAGRPVVVYERLPYGIERPQIAPDASFIFMAVAILIGTLLLLLIIKFRKISLWKVWFLAAIIVTLTVSFSSFLPKAVAVVISLALAYFRVLKPNVLAHNVSELFVYGGLAAIFVPIMNVRSAAILLVLVALYDVFAVFMSKHMVTMAKFQAENNIFAGLFVPKQLSAKSVVSAIPIQAAAKKHLPQPQKIGKERYSDTGDYAVVGGGDIGFPLLFAGAALVSFGLLKTLVIPVAAAAALTVLLIIGKKGKFYPAMPFIATGCFIGYAIASVL